MKIWRVARLMIRCSVDNPTKKWILNHIKLHQHQNVDPLSSHSHWMSSAHSMDHQCCPVTNSSFMSMIQSFVLILLTFIIGLNLSQCSELVFSCVSDIQALYALFGSSILSTISAPYYYHLQPYQGSGTPDP